MALSVLCDILPCVGPHMANVVSLTVSTVAANLASSNQEIHDAASQAITQLIQLVGMFFAFYFLHFNFNLFILYFSFSFLAVDSTIGSWHDAVVCSSVCLSVTPCTVAK